MEKRSGGRPTQRRVITMGSVYKFVALRSNWEGLRKEKQNMCEMLYLYKFYLCYQTRYTIISQHCEAASEATADTVCDSTQDGGASVNSEACAGVVSSRELNRQVHATDLELWNPNFLKSTAFVPLLFSHQHNHVDSLSFCRN